MPSPDTSATSLPVVPTQAESPGSSVSNDLQESYNHTLKFAVVLPTFETLQTNCNLLATAGTDAGVQAVQNVQHRVNETQTSQVSPSNHSDKNDTLPSIDIPLPEPEDEVMASRLQTSGKVRFSRNQHHFGRDLEISSDDTMTHETEDDFADDDRSRFSDGDEDIMALDQRWASWCDEIRHKVLREVLELKSKWKRNHEKNLLRQQHMHKEEFKRLQSLAESSKDLAATYENSIARKDQIITNLSEALQRQQQKIHMARSFFAWRVEHAEKQRQAVLSKIADQYRDRKLTQKCFVKWRLRLEANWRQRVEQACQARAEEVCLNLQHDYETKLDELNNMLTQCREEISRLKEEREKYEASVKQAFMRGVTALNMETLGMFQSEGESPDSQPQGDDVHRRFRTDYATEQPDSVSSSQMPRPGSVDSAASSLPSKVRIHVVSEGHDDGGMAEYDGELQLQSCSPTAFLGTGPSTRLRFRRAEELSPQRKQLRVPVAEITVPKRTPTGHSSGLPFKHLLCVHDTGDSSTDSRPSSRLQNLPKTQTRSRAARCRSKPGPSVVVERHTPIVKETIGQAIASKYPRSTNAQMPHGIGRPATGQNRKIPGKPSTGQQSVRFLS